MVDPAPFSECQLIHMDDYIRINDLLFIDEITDTNALLPIDKIIGVSRLHPEFIWGSFLNCRGSHGKMEDALSALAKNPDYYLFDEKKEYWSFYKIDDEYFISEGKHRTVTVRFFAHFNPQIFGENPMIRYCTVMEKIVDREFISFKKEINRLMPQHKNIKSFITHCVNDEKYSVMISVNGNYTHCFYRSELPMLVNALQEPCLLEWVRGNKFYSFMSFKACALATLNKWGHRLNFQKN